MYQTYDTEHQGWADNVQPFSEQRLNLSLGRNAFPFRLLGSMFPSSDQFGQTGNCLIATVLTLRRLCPHCLTRAAGDTFSLMHLSNIVRFSLYLVAVSSTASSVYTDATQNSDELVLSAHEGTSGSGSGSEDTMAYISSSDEASVPLNTLDDLDRDTTVALPRNSGEAPAPNNPEAPAVANQRPVRATVPVCLHILGLSDWIDKMPRILVLALGISAVYGYHPGYVLCVLIILYSFVRFDLAITMAPEN